MKEKDLENWIYELSQTQTGRDDLGYIHDMKGLLEVPMTKQVRLGGYGIIDLLQIDEFCVVGFELKTEPIQYKDIVQCCRYYEALKLLQREHNSLDTIKINLLVPHNGIKDKDACFLVWQLDFLQVQEYSVTPNNISFNTLTAGGFENILNKHKFDTFKFNQEIIPCLT